MAIVLVTLTAVLLAVLAVRLYRQAYERPPNFPPGPPRLPIWGSYWLLLLENYNFMHKATMAMARRYNTKVLGLFLGQFPAVVVTKSEEVREVLSRPEFAGRPDIVHVRARAFGQRLGIFFSDGIQWLEQKRFMLRNMRDYGFGRRFKSMEDVLQEQVEDVVALGRGELKDETTMKDGCMYFPDAVFPSLMRVLWPMLAGQQCPKEKNDEVRRVVGATNSFVKSVDQMGGAVAQTPWLRHVAAEATGFPASVRSSKVLTDTIKNVLDEHKDTFSDDHMRDFIDVYIREMGKPDRVKDFGFTEEQLQVIGADLLLAAGTTTTSTLTFAIRAILHHPEVQRRCQEEIDRVVGRDRLPTLDDRPNMPFTEATMRETLRRITLLPMGLPRITLEDTTLGGYNIPKNTLVFCNLHAVHNDEDVWGDPDNFRPERFLNEQGLLKKDMSTPFGAGKRLCPGETFARQGMFVILAALLQNFNLAPKDPTKLPAIDNIINGLSLTPPGLWVKLTSRF